MHVTKYLHMLYLLHLLIFLFCHVSYCFSYSCNMWLFEINQVLRFAKYSAEHVNSSWAVDPTIHLYACYMLGNGPTTLMRQGLLKVMLKVWFTELMRSGMQEVKAGGFIIFKRWVRGNTKYCVGTYSKCAMMQNSLWGSWNSTRRRCCINVCAYIRFW